MDQYVGIPAWVSAAPRISALRPMSQEARAGESSSTAGAPSGDAPTHSIKLGQTTFVVEIRYRPLRLLGQGTYGTVCAASVDGEGEQVAIKKIAGVFDAARSLTEGKRTLREMLLLRHLEHENVSGIRHVMLPKPGHDVYIVSDKMDFDLQRIISSTEPLTDDHCRYFLYQMLRGLKYVHSANVVHRDLKPSNVLLNANCDLKICDFGLARAMAEDESMKMTQYVVTRWYRAPEILLLVQRYTKAVDVWSVGCIFGEVRPRSGRGHGRRQRWVVEGHEKGGERAGPRGRVGGLLRLSVARAFGGLVRSCSGAPPSSPGARTFTSCSSSSRNLVRRRRTTWQRPNSTRSSRRSYGRFPSTHHALSANAFHARQKRRSSSWSRCFDSARAGGSQPHRHSHIRT